MLNECIPLYEPGRAITAEAEAAVTGKRFVDITDPMSSGPGLSDTAEGGNIVCSHATAGGKAIGVSSYDAAIEGKFYVITGGVVPVTADGAITAGQEVEVGTAGKAKTRAGTGTRAQGVAINSCADGEDCFVILGVGGDSPTA